MIESKQISISIIEDNKVIRENVTKYIEYSENMNLVNGFGSVESFLHHLKIHPNYQSDILLLDIGLPGKSGLEGIPYILEEMPDINIVMLTTYEEQEKIVKALCLGAVAYISKKTSLADIMKAVKLVNDGGSYMSPSIAREIVNHFTPKTASKSNLILTDRQAEILALLADGESYTGIGASLHISPETVKSHIKKIYRSLNVSNKAGAISKYIKGEI